MIAGMKCPVCKTETLQATTLQTGALGDGLSARQCSTCRGQWVEGELYLLWVEKHRLDQHGSAPAAESTAVGLMDSTKAKLCPTCGRLLTRAKVGRGHSFHLDRCGTCAGFWFDPGEWDALLAAGLHTEAHQAFSDAWQFEVQREDRRLQHEKMMIARLGEADWQEIQRVKTWIESHPRRVELFAVLTEGREELTNKTAAAGARATA
jgi:Zn-finger nucleic acid-binding protein